MSWEQIEETLRANRDDRRAEAMQPPVACPIDGEPLDVRPDGSRSCPLGNYTWRA